MSGSSGGSGTRECDAAPLHDRTLIEKTHQTNDGIDAGTSGIHFFLDGPDERTLCADVVAVDVAGNETPFPDRACVELKHTAEGAGFAGCASTSASASASGASPSSVWALLVIAAAGFVRRSARGLLRHQTMNGFNTKSGE